MINIEINLKEINKYLNHIINTLESVNDKALNECGKLIAIQESLRTKGNLSKSFFTFFTLKDGKNNVVVDSSKDYAKYLEFGRGPVKAINAKALRFFMNGEIIFRKSVGPMKAQPFVQQSINAATPKFTQIFDKHFSKLFKD
jgi:hypothetical protein